MNWYAVQTKSKKENLAAEHLRRQGFKAWFPECERIVSHARRSSYVKRPLFPSYIFVQIDIEISRWRSINSTIGVSRIVSFGQKPAQVGDHFITALKAAEKENGLFETYDDVLQPGQSVEILKGPMAGTVARLLRLEAGNRVTVLLKMLGNFVRGQVALDNIISA